MLGDINPQSVRIAQQAVVYPGRNHVNALTIKRYDGRRFEPVNLTDITRVVLAFPSTDPTVVFDSAVDVVFTWAGNTLTVDLSDYAMPASIQPCYLIVFDAEHPQGQVLVDNIDAVLEFDFRLVPITGTTPPPTADFLTDSPQDGETYGRKDGAWVPLAALVSGVASVNGKSGVVVLDAADVGAATAAQGALADSAVQPSDLADVATSGAYADLAGTPIIPSTPGDIGAASAAQGALADSAVQPEDLADVATSGAYADLIGTPSLGTAAGADTTAFDPAGAAVAAVGDHVAATDPHPQYQTQTESDARYERGLTAGANISIDRTNPSAPVISATGGGTGEANTASNVGAGAGLFKEKAGVDLRFKTLVAGANVSLVEDTDTVTINASGGGGSSAVDSVNGQTGDVVLDAADVGADPAGTAASAVTAHEAAADPHPQYLTPTEGNAAYAPLAHVGAGSGAHAAAVSGGAAGFMSGSDKAKLDGVAAGATANANTDSLAEGSTNLYFSALRVLATLMSGFTLVAGGTVLNTDSLLVAVGKLQSQINGLTTALSGKQDTLVSATNIKTINGASVLGSGDLTVSGGATLPVVQSLTSSRELALADANTFNVNSTADAYTATVPAQATVAWAADTEIHFLRSGAGAITLTADAGVSINDVVAASVTMNVQHGAATLKRVGEDAWWLGGLVASAAEQRAALDVASKSGDSYTGQHDYGSTGSLRFTGAASVGAIAAAASTGGLRLSVEGAEPTPLFIDFDASVPDAASTLSVRFFRGLNTSGACSFVFHKGNGTVDTQHTIDGKGAVRLNRIDGETVIGSGTSNNVDRLQVAGSIIATGAIKLASFTLATLPSAAANARGQVYCSNLTGGAAPVYSNGTNWRRLSDNSTAN